MEPSLVHSCDPIPCHLCGGVGAWLVVLGWPDSEWLTIERRPTFPEHLCLEQKALRAELAAPSSSSAG